MTSFPVEHRTETPWFAMLCSLCAQFRACWQTQEGWLQKTMQTTILLWKHQLSAFCLELHVLLWDGHTLYVRGVHSFV